MREIEIKARVTSVGSVLAALADNGIILSDPVEQHDYVYGLPNATRKTADSVWLRVRVEDNVRTMFTVKRSMPGSELDSIEHEVVVDDDEEIRKIIDLLGYVPYVEVKKTRQHGHQGDINICLDELEGLGWYVELEKMCENDSDGDATREYMWKLMDECGVKREDEIHYGYDTLVRQSLGLEDADS